MQKEKLLEKLNLNFTWGKILNKIQNVMLSCLDNEASNKILEREMEDTQLTEGMDCIIFNGQYFDWREFNTRKIDIVLAYLDYFNSNELELIYHNL